MEPLPSKSVRIHEVLVSDAYSLCTEYSERCVCYEKKRWFTRTSLASSEPSRLGSHRTVALMFNTPGSFPWRTLTHKYLKTG